MSKLMMTLHLDPKEASLAAVKRKLGLQAGEIDEEFGVVPIDPDANLFTVLVEEGVVTKVQGQEGVRGPFANPKIEPFGPPK
jgi:hypothetical protein